VKWGFLESVSSDRLDRVERQSVVRKFRKGQVVFNQGDRAESMYVVQTGRFETELGASDGNVMAARTLGPGAHFGELSLLDDRLLRTATVRASEASSALVISRAQFEDLRGDPIVDRALITRLTDLVVSLSEQAVDNAFLSAERRMAKRLLALAEAYSPGPLRPDSAISIPVTQEHLAMATGCTRPTINRLLSELETQSAIVRSRGQVIVHVGTLKKLSW
jgi:CRP/FNR family transcriptional regulator, cyclic AMP receptor protein